MRLTPIISAVASTALLCLCASAATCRQTPGSVLPIVDHYFSDPVLKRSWAVVIDCRHPGWPAQAVEVQSAGEEVRPVPAAVHPGYRVELWSDEGTHIRLSGIALESAIIGQTVHVRAGLGAVPLLGIVRGSHSVELIEGSKTGLREP
jgi:hypothetical protein